VVGRGWTGNGGRPHAEAVALEQAGEAARGATLYVTLEPCAHKSARGPACADLAATAGLSRAVIGVGDPDPRTAGEGIARLEAAGVAVTLADDPACQSSLAGYLTQRTQGRPHVTLKLAVTEDGFVARADGTSKWITGEIARAHAHRERARADAILVGRGTFDADAPKLNVRLPGLENRSPERFVLTSGDALKGWRALPSPEAIREFSDYQYLFVEGGAATARAFLDAGLVDRLLLYRAPATFGEGLSVDLPNWPTTERRTLGADTLEIFEPAR
jgi:diaminohydroxyphosphoribosylaminopyrimidine deaminase/5-amino-6-(5-phosphoribosylamino)uracil reductase